MKYLYAFIGIIISVSVFAQSEETLPPSPCLFFEYRVDPAGVFLGLMPTSSNHAVDHKLYRKKSASTEWKLLASFGTSVPEIYWDKTVESNVNYSYKWVAEDAKGRQSTADHSTIHITSFDRKISYSPELTVQSIDEGILIQLPEDVPGEDYRIEVIRSIKGSPYKTAKILKGGSTTYVDKIHADKMTTEQKQKMDVKYKARILYKDGKRSKYSKAIRLS